MNARGLFFFVWGAGNRKLRFRATSVYLFGRQLLYLLAMTCGVT